MDNATDALIGQIYTGPKGTIHVNREGIDGITGAEVADGRDDCIKAVRRQIGAGADWIKVRVCVCACMRVCAGVDEVSIVYS